MERRAFWAVVGVFCLGLIGGALLNQLYLGTYVWGTSGWKRQGERRETRILEHLARELNLSEKQKAEIAPILRETGEELFKLRVGFIQNIDRLLSESGNRIRPTLSEDQVEKFDELTKKYRERRNWWREHQRRRVE